MRIQTNFGFALNLKHKWGRSYVWRFFEIHFFENIHPHSNV